MTTEQLTTLLLGLAGVVIQLALKYLPKVRQWYEAQTNKGGIALAVVVLVGAVYYGLACSPWAAMIGITITCTTFDLFLLLKAIVNIAITQQLTFLYTRKSRR